MGTHATKRARVVRAGGPGAPAGDLSAAMYRTIGAARFSVADERGARGGTRTPRPDHPRMPRTDPREGHRWIA
jgi:hypothetical protein